MTKASKQIVSIWPLVILMFTSSATWPAHAADTDEPARITILDGEATLIDGAQRLVGVEGQTVNEQTLIETGVNTRLLRIEWPNGHTVDLGANTRAMLLPPKLDGRSSQKRSVYLLQGWAKYNTSANPELQGIVSPSFFISTATGAVTSYIDSKETWLFAESGNVLMTERRRSREKPVMFDLKPGSAYTRFGLDPGNVVVRPTSVEMKRVPVAFRDPLPLRYERIKNREIKTTFLTEPTYAELRPWLNAEPDIRIGFVTRFDKLLRNKDFRHEIIANMRDHREWYSVIYPLKTPTQSPNK